VPRPPMRRAVIYLQPGSVSQSRQAADCLAHCNLRRYRVAAVVPSLGQDDAVRTVLDGDADLIVTAYSARARPGDLRDVALAARVRVEYVRVPVLRRELGQLIASMYARAGGNVRQVAEQTGITSQEIRATIARMDELRNEAPPHSRWRGRRRHDGS
jgi:hypothetical protein